MGVKTYIIAGNHDQYFKNTYEINALDEIIGNRYNDIHCYNLPELIDIEGRKIQLLPWINEANYDQSMEAIANSPAKVIVGHLELKGFEMFRGVVSDHGQESSLFESFDLVFSGHFHKRSTKGNIHYLGAFAEYTWADYNDPRGFTILDTQDLSFEFIRNPYSIFKIIRYNDVKTPNIEKKIKFEDYKNVYVKVICEKKENPYVFDMFLDKLYKAEPIDISIIEDEILLDSEEDESLDDVQETTKILDTYITSLKLPLDNNRMKLFMRNIYDEAVSLENTN
jgi:DNA repair exonuclease SbcCD nuclease subunit